MKIAFVRSYQLRPTPYYAHYVGLQMDLVERYDRKGLTGNMFIIRGDKNRKRLSTWIKFRIHAKKS